jgi:hypothetical protein
VAGDLAFNLPRPLVLVFPQGLFWVTVLQSPPVVFPESIFGSVVAGEDYLGVVRRVSGEVGVSGCCVDANKLVFRTVYRDLRWRFRYVFD